MPSLDDSRENVPSLFRAQLGSRLRAIRESQGLRQRELAELANLRADRVNKYESGLQPPPALSLYRLARALNRPIDLFFPEAKFRSEGDQLFYSQVRRAWGYPSAEIRLGIAVLIRTLCDILDQCPPQRESKIQPREVRRASRA